MLTSYTDSGYAHYITATYGATDDCTCKTCISAAICWLFYNLNEIAKVPPETELNHGILSI